MNGSEKQITWAEQIKASFQDTLKGKDKNSFFNKFAHVGANKVASGKLTAEQLAEVTALLESAFASVLQNNEAKFWIDNRNAMNVERLFAYLPAWAQRHTPSMILDNAANQ